MKNTSSSRTSASSRLRSPAKPNLKNRSESKTRTSKRSVLTNFFVVHPIYEVRKSLRRNKTAASF